MERSQLRKMTNEQLDLYAQRQCERHARDNNARSAIDLAREQLSASDKRASAYLSRVESEISDVLASTDDLLGQLESVLNHVDSDASSVLSNIEADACETMERARVETANTMAQMERLTRESLARMERIIARVDVPRVIIDRCECGRATYLVRFDRNVFCASCCSAMLESGELDPCSTNEIDVIALAFAFAHVHAVSVRDELDARLLPTGLERFL